MKISVIVPYEGYYQYLKDCLESLSEQENVEIETLLVGSQDDQKFQCSASAQSGAGTHMY